MIPVTNRIALDESEIEESFIRASGPGGQNVNKLSSAVQLRFDVRRSPNLPDDVRARLERAFDFRFSFVRDDQTVRREIAVKKSERPGWMSRISSALARTTSRWAPDCDRANDSSTSRCPADISNAGTGRLIPK